MCLRSTRECFLRAEMEYKASFGCGMIQIQPVPSAEQVQAKFLANGCLQRSAMCNGCCNPPSDEGEPSGDGSCCYTFCSAACCGRPFMVEGVARTAGLWPRSDWFHPAAAPTHLDARIAAEWLEDARMEHASIASFARFTLELLAWGAPADLVEMAQRAGLDEIEHARLCFGLATHFGSEALGPSQLTAAGVELAPSLWAAALATFQEGCIAETLAALQAGAALARARDPEARRALERIAEDEARHAELAWRFVTWATARLGTAFPRELDRSLQALLNVPEVEIAEREDSTVRDTLHAAGRLTRADKHRIDRAGLREVIAPCLAALQAMHVA